MLDIQHLKIIHALQQHGTVTGAAQALYLTQSALSHQIRHLEQKIGVKLWERHGRHLRLTHAGEVILQAAQHVLPVLEHTERTLRAHAHGQQGILRIGVECYPCQTWLNAVIGAFLKKMPRVEIDIVNQFPFSGLHGLLYHHLDLLITPDQQPHPKLNYERLGDDELLLLVAKQHPLSIYTNVQAQQLANETLLTFPVAHERVDVLTRFLVPAQVRPLAIKTLQSVDLMVHLVALQRGVCVLPRWLAESYLQQVPLAALRLGERGLYKTLFAAFRQQDACLTYLERFVSFCKQDKLPFTQGEKLSQLD